MYDSGHYISCCKDCEDRFVGCHSKCDKYKKQIEEWEKAKKEYRKKKTLIICQSDFNNYVGKRTKRHVIERI